MKADWEIATIGSVCKVIAGQSPPGTAYNDQGFGLPFYQGKKEFGAQEIGSPSVWTNVTTKITEPGDILMSVRAPVGPVNFSRRRACIGRGLSAIRASAKVDANFLFYNLWMRQADIGGKEGAVFASINRADIEAIEIPLPPLEEQRRIVAVLDEAFATIATATANAEKNLANARELFEVQREHLLRNTASGWLRKPLSSLCTVKHGFAFKSEHFCESGEHILLTPGNFFEAGGYRDRGPKQKYYSGPIPEGFVLRGGDLLVAMTEQAAGLLGSPVLVPTAHVFLHNQRLGLIEPKPGIEWANEFFFHVFNTRYLRDHVHRTGTGQKVRHTSPSKIGDVDVYYPDTRAEQLAVASHLEEIWSETEQLAEVQARRLVSLNGLKQSLLHRAFTGELTATAPETIAA